MTNTKVTNWLQKNTMVLILVLVFVFFAFQKDGAILLPQNITSTRMRTMVFFWSQFVTFVFVITAALL